MPRLFFTDASGTPRLLKRIGIRDSGGTTRMLKRMFIRDTSGIARLVYIAFAGQTDTYNIVGTYTVAIPFGAQTMVIEGWGPSGPGGTGELSSGRDEGGGGGGSGGYFRSQLDVSAYNGLTIQVTIAATGGVTIVQSGSFSLTTMSAPSGGPGGNAAGLSGGTAGAAGGVASGGNQANGPGNPGQGGGDAIFGKGGAGVVGINGRGPAGGNGVGSGGTPGPGSPSLVIVVFSP